LQIPSTAIQDGGDPFMYTLVRQEMLSRSCNAILPPNIKLTGRWETNHRL